MVEKAFRRSRSSSVSAVLPSADSSKSTEVSKETDSRSLGKARAAAKIAEIRARAKSLAEQRRRRTSLELPRRGVSLLDALNSDGHDAPISSRPGHARAKTPPPASQLDCLPRDATVTAIRQTSLGVAHSTKAESPQGEFLTVDQDQGKDEDEAEGDGDGDGDDESEANEPQTSNHEQTSNPGHALGVVVRPGAQSAVEAVVHTSGVNSSSSSPPRSASDTAEGVNDASVSKVEEEQQQTPPSGASAPSRADNHPHSSHPHSSSLRSRPAVTAVELASSELVASSSMAATCAATATATACQLPDVRSMSIATIAREIAAISTARHAQRRLMAAARADWEKFGSTVSGTRSIAVPRTTPSKFLFGVDHPLGGAATAVGSATSPSRQSSGGAQAESPVRASNSSSETQFRSPEPGVPITGYAGGREAISHLTGTGGALRPLARGHAGSSARDTLADLQKYLEADKGTSARIPASVSYERSQDLCMELERRVQYFFHPPVPPVRDPRSDEDEGTNRKRVLSDPREHTIPTATPGKHPRRALTKAVTRAAVTEIQPGLGRMSKARKKADARMRKATGLVPKRAGPRGTYVYLEEGTGSRRQPATYEDLYHAVTHREVASNTSARAWEHTALRRATYRRYGIRLPPFGGELEVDEVAEQSDAWWRCDDDAEERAEEDDFLDEVEDVWGPLAKGSSVEAGEGVANSDVNASDMEAEAEAEQASWWRQTIGHSAKEEAEEAEAGEPVQKADQELGYLASASRAAKGITNCDEENDDQSSVSSLDSEVGRPRVLFAHLDEAENTVSQDRGDKEGGSTPCPAEKRDGVVGIVQVPLQGTTVIPPASDQDHGQSRLGNADADVSRTPAMHQTGQTADEIAAELVRLMKIAAASESFCAAQGTKDAVGVLVHPKGASVATRAAAARVRAALLALGQAVLADPALSTAFTLREVNQSDAVPSEAFERTTTVMSAPAVTPVASQKPCLPVSPDLLGQELRASSLGGRAAMERAHVGTVQPLLSYTSRRELQTGSHSATSPAHAAACSLDESDLFAASPSGFAFAAPSTSRGDASYFESGTRSTTDPDSVESQDRHVHHQKGEIEGGDDDDDDDDEADLLGGLHQSSLMEEQQRGGSTSPPDDYDPFADAGRVEDEIEDKIEDEEENAAAESSHDASSRSQSAQNAPSQSKEQKQEQEQEQEYEDIDEDGATPTPGAPGGSISIAAGPAHRAGSVLPPALPRHAPRRRRGQGIDVDEDEPSLGFGDDDEIDMDEDNDDEGDIAGTFVNLLAPTAGGRAPKRRQSAMPSKAGRRAAATGVSSGARAGVGTGTGVQHGGKGSKPRGRQSLCVLPLANGGGSSLLMDLGREQRERKEREAKEPTGIGIGIGIGTWAGAGTGTGTGTGTSTVEVRKGARGAASQRRRSSLLGLGRKSAWGALGLMPSTENRSSSSRDERNTSGDAGSHAALSNPESEMHPDSSESESTACHAQDAHKEGSGSSELGFGGGDAAECEVGGQGEGAVFEAPTKGSVGTGGQKWSKPAGKKGPGGRISIFMSRSSLRG